jgi:hypothetical protein
MPALAALAKELLEQEATGDRARTAAGFAKCGSPGSSETRIRAGFRHSSGHSTHLFVPRGDSMSEQQNYSNHGKIVPAFHFVLPVLALNLIWAIRSFFRACKTVFAIQR